MNKSICLSVVSGAIILFSCNNPATPEEPPLNLGYVSVTGNQTIQKDITGSGTCDKKECVLTTKNANGLWSAFEEIGFYYAAKPVFNGTISADFENMTGSDTLIQGGLMIRGSKKGGAPYAALRLAQNIYDPVARLDSTASAAAAGSSIKYQKGDFIYITCLEKQKNGTIRNFDMEVGAKRGELILISKTFAIKTTSDSLYIGLFCADRSTSDGSFSVSNITMR
jgi:hypothetical protein